MLSIAGPVVSSFECKSITIRYRANELLKIHSLMTFSCVRKNSSTFTLSSKEENTRETDDLRRRTHGEEEKNQ